MQRPFEIDSALLDRYKRRGLLVDSSLLVVYLIGSFDRRQLVNCRAIKSSFSEAEFELLAQIIAQFDALITTPHVLTEVSNLAGRLPYNLHIRFRTFFATVMPQLSENNVAAVDLAATAEFARFGVTDTAIGLVAAGQFLVLTEEVALYSLLSGKGVDVMNFSHVRLLA